MSPPGRGVRPVPGRAPEPARLTAGLQAGTFQAPRQKTRSLLTGLVGILVEGDIDATAGLITKLGPLRRCQVSADGTGGVTKASLPEHGQIEKSFHQDHGREGTDRVPGKQAPLRARQQSVREGGADTATRDTHYAALLVKRKDDSPAEGIPALVVDQACPQHQVKGIAAIGQMTPQIAAGSIAQAQFLNQVRISQTSTLQILNRLGITVE